MTMTKRIENMLYDQGIRYNVAVPGSSYVHILDIF